MIKIKTFESGSSGNLHMIDDGGKRLLLECGVNWKNLLRYLDYDLSFSGCLLSHYHGDHSGVKLKGKEGTAHNVLKNGIDLYCTKETADQLGLSGSRLKIIDADKRFMVGDDFNCMCFKTNHDTLGSVGFLVDSGNDRVLFATDTGSIPYKFPGMTHIMIECNYDESIMKDMNEYLEKRVKKTHMSLDDCREFLSDNDLSKVKEIRLIHLSSSNADAAEFKKSIQSLTGVPVIV